MSVLNLSSDYQAVWPKKQRPEPLLLNFDLLLTGQARFFSQTRQQPDIRQLHFISGFTALHKTLLHFAKVSTFKAGEINAERLPAGFAFE